MKRLRSTDDPLIPCSCGRISGHYPACLVAQAFRFRCPDCRARNRGGSVRHSYYCKLKEYQP